jgi:uncharacterized repeat protein (TIGR03803 family)
VQATNGNFYGTTRGTVFEITPAGALTVLQSEGSDAGLVQASSGNLYGTTVGGGGSIYCVGGCGTVFEITPKGTLTTLYSFCTANCTDGNSPAAALIQATDGSLYGTTPFGGNDDGGGTIFKITPKGKLTTLYDFCSQVNCDDGFQPDSSLFQATNGSFYGTTPFGGIGAACIYGCGTVYSLSTGLGPFVETLPASGKVGAKIIILGNNLTGSTAVTFNGKSAAFTVVSDTEITATAPTGATTGKVAVTTPSGVLKSNVSFRLME